MLKIFNFFSFFRMWWSLEVQRNFTGKVRKEIEITQFLMWYVYVVLNGVIQ